MNGNSLHPNTSRPGRAERLAIDVARTQHTKGGPQWLDL